MSRPTNMPKWMRWVEGKLRILEHRTWPVVPVGGAVVWTGTVDPPDGWLLADGTAFDPDEWPLLLDALELAPEDAVLPDLGSLGEFPYLLRAE